MKALPSTHDIAILALAAGAWVLASLVSRRRRARHGRCACGEPLEPGKTECDRCWWERQAP